MKRKILWALAMCMAFVLIAGCATAAKPPSMPLGQPSFNEYAFEARLWVEKNRAFQSGNWAIEAGWNSPHEWRPSGRINKGVLLVHGLGDSPWSFVDIGKFLADRGYLVRTVLLPGHGTKPEDLIDVDIADWRRLVKEQVALLRADVGDVYLGGFSTGANLVLEYALDNDEAVSGLLLFSPALQSSMTMDWVTPWLAKVRTWVIAPDAMSQQQTPVRYMNVPSNGFAQFYRTSAAVREKLSGKPYRKPALLVAAQHDSVVDVEFLRQTFTEKFPHPASRMIWYGVGEPSDTRVLVRPDRLEALRISEFSHMSVLFSPTNPLYGREGSQRMCNNGQESDGLKQCEAGAEVWYSDWGYKEEGKVHARLTFNPYFEWQAEVMTGVIDGDESMHKAGIVLDRKNVPDRRNLETPEIGVGSFNRRSGLSDSKQGSGCAA